MKLPDRHATASAGAEALTGLIIALLLSSLIFFTPLRQVTSDLSQRILLAAGTDGGAMGVASQPHGVPVRDWIFIDLGGRFCNPQPGQGPSRCPPDRRLTDRRALASLLTIVRAAKPRVIIFDVATGPGDDPLEDEALRAVLKQRGSPVLLAWSPNPAATSIDDTGDIGLPLDQAGLWCPLQGCTLFPDARYLPALVENPDGPVTRKLGIDYRIKDEQGGYRLPSIALGAALVAAAPADQPWSLLDGFPQSGDSQGGASDCSPPRTTACLNAFRQSERVLSFRPVRPADDQAGASGDTVNFIHQLPDADSPKMELPADAVVVIGNASQAARDGKWAAVGIVSGGELILNDVRQFLIAPPVEKQRLVSYLWGEWPFFLLGTLVLFAVGLAFPNLRKRRHPTDRTAAARDDLKGGIRALGKLLCIALGNLVLFAILLRLRGSVPGAPPDFISPFVGILIETSFEALHQFANSLHETMYCLLAGKAPKAAPPKPPRKAKKEDRS